MSAKCCILDVLSIACCINIVAQKEDILKKGVKKWDRNFPSSWNILGKFPKRISVKQICFPLAAFKFVSVATVLPP